MMNNTPETISYEVSDLLEQSQGSGMMSPSDSSRESTGNSQYLFTTPPAQPARAVPQPAEDAAEDALTVSLKYGVLEGASMEDVELVSEAIYPITKNSTIMTRVKSIKGVAIKDVGVKLIDSWATAQGVKIPRKKKKKEDVCALIVDFKVLKDRQDAQVANGSTTVQPAVATASTTTTSTANRRVIINYPRLVNMIADEQIKAAFIARGNTLSKDDLEDGKKADADLYKTIAETYNDTSKAELNTLRWEVDWKHTPDPSSFDPIDAEKAKASVSSLASTYEKAYQNWKVSGFNEGIECVEFVKFGGGWIHYLHQILLPFPDLFKSMTAELPDGVFAESSGTSKKRSTKRGRSSSTGNDSNESMTTMAQAAVQRSNAFEYAALHNASMQTKQEIATAKKQKKESMHQLKNHEKVLSGSHAKQIVEYVGKHRHAKASNEELNHSEEEFPFSQQSINSFDTRVEYANDIIDQNDILHSATERLKQQEAKMNSKLNKQADSNN